MCHNQRIHSHKVFEGLAARGQCSLGWFYGFKLHLVTSVTGHIIDVMLTPANTDDRTALKHSGFTKKLFGKLFGDKGYISKALFEDLFFRGTEALKTSSQTCFQGLSHTILPKKTQPQKTLH